MLSRSDHNRRSKDHVRSILILPYAVIILLVNHLKAGVFASPLLREHYVQRLGRSNATKIEIKQRKTKRRDYLLSLMETLAV